MHPLIDSYDPPDIPLKPRLVSFSNLNPCASNRCHKWTILVHLLVFWARFLQVVQAKKGICFGMQMAPGARASSATARQTKGFLLWHYLFCCQHSRRTSYEIFRIFYGAILGSRTAVLEPRYPMLGVMHLNTGRLHHPSTWMLVHNASVRDVTPGAATLERDCDSVSLLELIADVLMMTMLN